MDVSPRIAAASLALGCTAAALAGCTQTQTRSAGFSSTGQAECEFTTWPGHLEGRGGTQAMINNAVYVGCGGGPTISLEGVHGDTVTFARKGAEVSVAEGATERVGPYDVHVVDVRGQRVEFELSRPDS